jgi:hypothetical protein
VQEDVGFPDDCIKPFFDGLEKMPDSNRAILVMKNGREMAWMNFLKNELMTEHANWGLSNFDNDTIPELLVHNYTGGAHCCEELYVFEKSGRKYKLKAKLFGGFQCIDASSKIVSFSFNETLGYFYSCYACGYQDSSAGFRPIREIDLKYTDGKFAVVPYNADVDKQVIKNLEILKEHGFEDIDQGLMDSGWRKEFALNLAVWHYNHGKNWTETKKLFDTYYPFKDATKIYKEFYRIIKDAEKESDI